MTMLYFPLRGFPAAACGKPTGSVSPARPAAEYLRKDLLSIDDKDMSFSEESFIFVTKIDGNELDQCTRLGIFYVAEADGDRRAVQRGE